MIFILSTLINVCLIFAVWRMKRELYLDASVYRNKIDRYLRTMLIRPFKIPELRKLHGKIDKMYIRSVIAEKMADRAFNMASSANLGVVALQKALATPRLMTKQQVVQNKLAKDGVDKLFTNQGNFDWLRPILSDEELDILDEVEKQNGQHNVKDTQ